MACYSKRSFTAAFFLFAAGIPGIKRGKQWYPFFHCDIMRIKNRIFLHNTRDRRKR